MADHQQTCVGSEPPKRDLWTHCRIHVDCVNDQGVTGC